MKAEEIKEHLRQFGIRVKTKERESGKFYLLKSDNFDELQQRITKLSASKIERTEKGLLLPKQKEFLEQLLKSFSLHQNKSTNAEVADHEKLIKQFTEQARKNGYTEKTIKNYRNHFLAFVRKVGNKDFANYTPKEIEKYLAQRAAKKEYSVSDTNMHINALRFFFEDVLKRKDVLVKTNRPKKPGKTSFVLEANRLQTLLQQTPNLKHRAIYILYFELRVKTSEIASLKIKDFQLTKGSTKNSDSNRIDYSENEISKTSLVILKNYLNELAPKTYWFEGTVPGKPIGMRAIQKVLLAAKIKTGLLKINSVKKRKATEKKK
jgi:integrase